MQTNRHGNVPAWYIGNLRIANRIKQNNVGSVALTFELFDKVNIVYKYVTYAGPSSRAV